MIYKGNELNTFAELNNNLLNRRKKKILKDMEESVVVKIQCAYQTMLERNFIEFSLIKLDIFLAFSVAVSLE